jgi:TolB protein
MKMFLLLCCVSLAIGQYCCAQTQYKILYNVLEDKSKDNYEIYSMNMDGTGKKNITNTPGVEWAYYAWKDKVYYVSDEDTCHRCYFLYEMDAEGNNKRKVSDLQLEDSWMSGYEPGAGLQLFVMGRQGKIRNQLFQINTKDGLYKQITNDTVSTKRDPLCLPRWHGIVMAYRPDKALRKTVPDELWILGFDEKVYGRNTFGVEKKQLTFYPKDDTTAQWFEYHAGPTPNGKKQRQITNGELSSGWHSWSSDGKWLAMDKATPDEKGYDIYLMNYKTKKTVQLTNDAKYEQAPVIVEVIK